MRRRAPFVLAAALAVSVTACSNEASVATNAKPEGLSTTAVPTDPAAAGDPYAVWNVPAGGQPFRPWEFESLEQFRDWTDTVIVGQVKDVRPIKEPALVNGIIDPGTLRYAIKVKSVVGGRFDPKAAPGTDPDTVTVDVPVVAGPGVEFTQIVRDITGAPRSGRYLLFLNHVITTNPLARTPIYQIADAPDGLLVDDPQAGLKPPKLRYRQPDVDKLAAVPPHEAETGLPAQGSSRSKAVAAREGEALDAVVSDISRKPGAPVVPAPRTSFDPSASTPVPPPDPSWPTVAS